MSVIFIVVHLKDFSIFSYVLVQTKAIKQHRRIKKALSHVMKTQTHSCCDVYLLWSKVLRVVV